QMPAHIFGSSLITWAGRAIPVPHVDEGVGTANDDLRLPTHDDALLLQSLQADRHPLPSRTDNVGEIGMGKRACDEASIGVPESIGIDEMEQQMRQPLGNRAGAEHLHKGGIALALERKTFD